MAKKVQYTDILGEGLSAELVKKFSAMGKASIDAYVAQIQAGMKNINISDVVNAKNIKGQAGIASQIDNAKTKLTELTEMGKKYQQVVNQISMTKLQTKVDTSAIGSYNRLNAELNLNIAKLKALGSTEAYAFQTKKKLTTEIQRQDAELKKLDATMGRHQRNVGNYKSALVGLWGSIKSLAAAYVGLYAIVGAVKDIFGKTTELNALSFSLKVLIRNTKELADTQNFLAGIAERFGLNILSTSQSYLKFRASILGTNFDLKESQRLFESVAKAGAVLGLRADRMELVFLALEQMISKGTISTEELRRQLGDLLPGSVQIMANALDVTIPKLLQMIKANKVLATDALPKFRIELERTYGLNSITNINTLQASIGRMQTSWLNFVKTINATEFSKTVVDALSGLINLFVSHDIKIETQGMVKYSEMIGKINLQLDVITKKEEKIGKPQVKVEKENAVYKYWLDAVNMLGRYEKEAKSYFGSKEAEVWAFAYKKLAKELDDLLISMGKADLPIDLIEDEELTRLKDAVNLSKGFINNLKAKIALNEYLINQSADLSDISRMELENKEWTKQIELIKEVIDWEKQLKDWQDESADAIKNSLSEIETENEKLYKQSKYRTDAFVKGYEDFQTELERFNKKMGITQDEFYKRDLELLKYDLDTKKITEEQYLINRVRLWVKYNQNLLDNMDNFAQSFTYLLSEINQGQLDAAQEEVDIQEDKLSKLKDQLDEEKALKDKGKANDYDRLVDSIAEQEKLRDSANKKLAKQQKIQAQIQLASQLSSIATAAAGIIESMTAEFGWVGAIAGLAEVAALIAAWMTYKNKINSLDTQQYAEGTESVEGPGTTTSDSVHARLSKGERVVPAKINDYLLGIPNNDLPALASIYRLNFNKVPDNVQVYNSYAEVVDAIDRSRKVSEKMLKNQEDTPTFIVLPDGKLQLNFGKYKTQIVTIK